MRWGESKTENINEGHKSVKVKQETQDGHGDVELRDAAHREDRVNMEHKEKSNKL